MTEYKRFYVETSDEYGITEYDAFDTVEEATALAHELLTVGFRYAVVADRVEMLPIAKLGDLPQDWRS